MFSLISTVVVIGEVTKRVIMPLQTPQVRKKPPSPIGYLTGQNTPVSNFFCQQNLTQNLFWVQNKDNYFFQKMGNLGKLGNSLKVLAAATMLTGAAEAQETNDGVILAAATDTSALVEHCGEFAKQQRLTNKELGITMTRAEVGALLAECHSGALAKRITEQNQILATLDEQIRQLDLRLDDQARILDENGQVIAHIVTINGQLIIRIQNTENRIAETDARIAAKLREAERILQSLATS